MPVGPFRPFGRIRGILPVLVLFLSSVFPSGTHAQPASSIGVYADADHSSCSLSDAGDGLIRAYVVASSQNGITGVRFAAPKPACFNATWLMDEIPNGYITIGESQTDLSIATGACIIGPTHVATLVFQKTGSTGACCEFPLIPSPIVNDVIFADCSFTEYPMPVTSGFINGDESCPCAPDLDLPPSTPFNPSPQSGTINRPLSLTLYWEATDPEGRTLHYDLYFGTAADPPLVASGLTVNGYVVSGLEQATRYHWKVVAFDPANHAAEGMVWYFETGSPGLPPPPPINPDPVDGATDRLRMLTLTWEDSLGTGVVNAYDIHFGTTPTPPKVGDRPASQRSWQVSNLALDTTYYWYIVSVGNWGQTTTGKTWSFHTIATGVPPNAPANPTPADGAQTVSINPTLIWNASDPEGQTLKYDLYFGTDPDPPFLQQVTTSYFGVVSLTPLVDYYWRVVAIDTDGLSASGPVWTFKTTTNAPPTVPTLVQPSDGAAVSASGVKLGWSSTDPEGGPLSYAVYFGTSSPPPLYLSNTTSTNVNLPTLTALTTYYWQIVAKDSGNLTTAGPVWSFHTNDTSSPVVPYNPSPTDGMVNVHRGTSLFWSCTDPDSPQLTYDVYFGTSSPPPQVATVPSRYYTPVGPLPLNALEREKLYYWKVVAHDPDNHTTEGPVWSFTTSSSNLPPITPNTPIPANNATDQPVSMNLKWASNDPEGLGMRYDVYFGTGANPPLVATNVTSALYFVGGLFSHTDYYWKIVARDVDGNEATGAVWKFQTGLNPNDDITMGLYSDVEGTSCRLADTGAGIRNVYVVLDGPATYTGCRFAAPVPSCFGATWLADTTPYVTIGTSPEDVSIGFGFCLPPPIMVMTISYMSTGSTEGCCSFPLTQTPFTGLLVTDCNFAELDVRNFPVLGISPDNSCPPCEDYGYLRFSEAADTCRVGPSRLVTVDLELSPVDSVSSGGIAVTFSPSLTFVSCERGALTQDWTTFDHNVVGNTLTISGTAHPGYDPQRVGVFAHLTFETNCCQWNDPAELHLSGATGDLAGLNLIDRTLPCRFVADGDVNNDGAITVSDAQCALQAYLYEPLPIPGGCGGPSYVTRSDVDCSGSATPADAYCIFRHWLDQSCSFCSGAGAALAATGGVAPQLALRAVREDDEVVVVLRANGAGDVDALGLELQYPAGLELVRIEPPRNDAYAALQTRVVASGRVRIGAYANAGRAPSANGDLIAVRFRAKDGTVRGTVMATRFVDALAGAPDVAVSLDGSAVTPAVHEVVLHQNSPNPFNPRTSIRFELPDAMRARLRIFDVHGRLVKLLLDERREAGASTVEWDGTDEHGDGVATGVYFYVLDAGSKRIQHKMVLLK